MQAIYTINLDSKVSQEVFSELSTVVKAKINNIENLSKQTFAYIYLIKIEDNSNDFLIYNDKYTTTSDEANELMREKIIKTAIAQKIKNIEFDITDFDFSKIVAKARDEENKEKEKEKIKQEMIELAKKRGIETYVQTDCLYTSFKNEQSNEERCFKYDVEGMRKLQKFDVDAHKKMIQDRIDAEAAEKQKKIDEEVAEKQKKIDEEVAYEKEKQRWIKENGSETLQKAFVAGYTCEKRYFEERLEKEAGTDYDTLENDEVVKKRSCPSAKALAELEEAQKIDKNAKIVCVVDERHEDSYEAVRISFLEREVFKRINSLEN